MYIIGVICIKKYNNQPSKDIVQIKLKIKRYFYDFREFESHIIMILTNNKFIIKL